MAIRTADDVAAQLRSLAGRHEHERSDALEAELLDLANALSGMGGARDVPPLPLAEVRPPAEHDGVVLHWLEHKGTRQIPCRWRPASPIVGPTGHWSILGHDGEYTPAYLARAGYLYLKPLVFEEAAGAVADVADVDVLLLEYRSHLLALLSGYDKGLAQETANLRWKILDAFRVARSSQGKPAEHPLIDIAHLGLKMTGVLVDVANRGGISLNDPELASRWDALQGEMMDAFRSARSAAPAPPEPGSVHGFTGLGKHDPSKVRR